MDDMVSIFEEKRTNWVFDQNNPIVNGDDPITMIIYDHTKILYPGLKISSEDAMIFEPFPGITFTIDTSILVSNPNIVFNTKNRAHVPIISLLKYDTNVYWNDEVINKENIGGLFRIDTIHRGETKYTTEIGILQNFNSNVVHFDCLSKIPNKRHITSFDKWISISAHHDNAEILVKRLESEDVKFF